MLEVHVERIEAGGAGDARDLDGADEPHCHRRHHLVARELRFDIVAQDVADQHRTRLPVAIPVAIPLASAACLFCMPFPLAFSWSCPGGGAMLSSVPVP